MMLLISSPCMGQEFLRPSSRIMLVGDSFANDFGDWASRVNRTPELTVDFFAAGGRTVGGMAVLFPSQYQENTYEAVVIAGGVNDLLGAGRSSEQIQASINSIISQTNGEHIILTTIPPFRGRDDLWTPARQEVADQVSQWVLDLAETSPNISVFDIRNVLDPDGDQIISLEAASGDLFHPSTCGLSEECGASIIAEAFTDEFVFNLGDLNGDGSVNFLDISPLISLLTTGGFQEEADINDDGLVNFLDISPFISLLN